MKIKEGFKLRKVASQMVVLPVGKASVNFNGMMALNETGVLLWNILEQGGDKDVMVKALVDEYEVDAETAASDVDKFMEKLKCAGCIE